MDGIGSSTRAAFALLVVNPRSRRGRDAAGMVAAVLERAGLRVVPRDCEDQEEVPRLIRDAAGEVDRVVLGGGDGTLNAALPGLAAAGLPLCIVPLGKANDLARTLGGDTHPVRRRDHDRYAAPPARSTPTGRSSRAPPPGSACCAGRWACTCRKLLAVHYPTDVLAGLVLGGAWLLLAILAARDGNTRAQRAP